MNVMEPIGTAIPVFESTGQAIHVAFTIMSQPAQQDSMMRKALIGMLAGMPSLSPRLNAWLQQLRGSPSETVHFGGVDAFDVRAQCALVISAVNTKLPPAERCAIIAKYAQTDFEDIDGRRRFAFSAEKIEAIKFLSQWIYDSFAARGPAPVTLLALDCIVARVYAHHKKIEISFRGLAKSFGGHHMIYARLFPKIRARLRTLEDMAISRLDPYFEETGVVVDQRST